MPQDGDPFGNGVVETEAVNEDEAVLEQARLRHHGGLGRKRRVREGCTAGMQHMEMMVEIGAVDLQPKNTTIARRLPGGRQGPGSNPPSQPSKGPNPPDTLVSGS